LVRSFEQRIAALEARLNRNSSNSSRPPSTEPLHVKRQPPKPTSKKRSGGRLGHERHMRELVPPERLTGVVEIRPDICSGCGRSLNGQDPEPTRHRSAAKTATRAAYPSGGTVFQRDSGIRGVGLIHWDYVLTYKGFGA
jgi:hypothetical protein